MSAPAPTPALARLRSRWASAGPPRVLVHAGTCGMQAGAGEVAQTLRARLPRAAVVTAACDGACWAAPSATVERDGHAHRFARLDRGVPDGLAACLAGDCDDEYAGRGERALMARLGRNDGTLGDVIAGGAYVAWARASTIAPAATVQALRAVAAGDRAGAFTAALARWEASAGGAITIDARSAPGAVAARHLMQGDPHRVIEGILVAARAAGAERASVGFAPDEPLSRTTFEGALAEARAAGILDGSALGGAAVAVEVGEAPRGRIDEGRIDDVQAVAVLSLLFDSPPPPTRLLTLAGDLARPGVYETPIDGAMTWAGVLSTAGTSPARVPGLLVGGPSGRLVRRDAFDTPLAAGALGSGAVMVLPPGADLEGFDAS